MVVELLFLLVGHALLLRLPPDLEDGWFCWLSLLVGLRLTIFPLWFL